jgi:hypothetical protein
LNAKENTLNTKENTLNTKENTLNTKENTLNTKENILSTEEQILKEKINIASKHEEFISDNFYHIEGVEDLFKNDDIDEKSNGLDKIIEELLK